MATLRHMAWGHALVAALALAGCSGGLDTPDLGHGNVSGRLVGGRNAQALVYPLGRPDLAVTPDAEGGFELEHLPVGDVTLVIYDGTIRAERSVVTVRGSELERRVWFGEDAQVPEEQKIAVGGRVVAAVLPMGGAVAVASRVSLLDTPLRAKTSADGIVVVGVVPVGGYQLRAELAGYDTRTDDIEVTPQTSVHEVSLEVSAGGAAPGCAAEGAVCRNGLKCDLADGQCYQCLVDRDCSGGAACDLVNRFCVAPTSGGSGAICSVCTADAQCGDPALGAFCEKPGGAGDEAPSITGFCTRSDVAASGPAGFERQDGPRGKRWVPVGGCADYFEEFGCSCFADSTCSGEDGIAGGLCSGADAEAGKAGYCTAACASDADCLLPDFTCQPAAGSSDRVCTRLTRG